MLVVKGNMNSNILPFWIGGKNVDSLQISGVIVEWEENEFCHNQ